MRRVLGDTLRGLGVDEESVYDILLAATEACTNVLTHGGRQVRDYAVVTGLGAVGCQVEVRDDGVGLALPGLSRRRRIRSRRRSPSCPSPAAAWPSCGPAWTTSPSDSRPGRGTVVTMRKRISWAGRRPPLRASCRAATLTDPRSRRWGVPPGA